VAWLIKIEFLIGHWFIWHLHRLQLLITIHSRPSRKFSITAHIELSLFHNYYLLSWTAVPRQSSGTSFQRWTFTFLGSRTAHVPQPQLLTVRSPSGTASFCLLLFCLELCPTTDSCYPVSLAYITPGSILRHIIATGSYFWEFVSMEKRLPSHCIATTSSLFRRSAVAS
jgi:hypothetical protein